MIWVHFVMEFRHLPLTEYASVIKEASMTVAFENGGIRIPLSMECHIDPFLRTARSGWIDGQELSRLDRVKTGPFHRETALSIVISMILVKFN